MARQASPHRARRVAMGLCCSAQPLAICWARSDLVADQLCRFLLSYSAPFVLKIGTGRIVPATGEDRWKAIRGRYPDEGRHAGVQWRVPGTSSEHGAATVHYSRHHYPLVKVCRISNQGSWPCSTLERPTMEKPAAAYSGIWGPGLGEGTLGRVGLHACKACTPQLTGIPVPGATDQILFAQEEDAACPWPALLYVLNIVSKEPAGHRGDC